MTADVCGALYTYPVDFVGITGRRKIACTLPPGDHANHEDHSREADGGDVYVWKRVIES